MRCFLTLLGCFMVTTAGFSQIFDRSLSFGFQTSVQSLRPGGPDRWLALLRGNPEPGAIFSDTLALVVFDDSANVVFTYRPGLPGEEVNFFHDGEALPDGGFVYSFESTLCDVANYKTAVGKVDSTGALQWQVSNSNSSNQAFPHLLEVLPDGNLLGYDPYGSLIKLDASNGAQLDVWPLQLAGGSSPYILDFKLIPGTNDFVAIGNPHVQKWTFSGNSYTLTATASIGTQFYPGGSLQPAGTGKWIFYSVDNNRFYQVNDQGTVTLLPMPILANVVDYAATDSGMLVLQRFDGVNTLSELFPDGSTQSYPMPDSQQIVSRLAIRDQQAAILGLDLYGRKLFDWSNDYPSFRTTSAAWLRRLNRQNPVAPELPDLALSEVQQQGPVEVQAIPGGFNLSGGQYRLRITNQGSAPVGECYLNFVAPLSWFPFICPSIEASQRHLAALNLAPGESVWIDWGDILLYGEPEIPLEICFSVSSPDRRPDRTHADNANCEALTTNIKTPEKPGFSLMPNPVSNGRLQVTLPPEVAPGPYTVFDLAGRPVLTGVLTGASPLEIAVDRLPAGCYGLRLGRLVEKFIVAGQR